MHKDTYNINVACFCNQNFINAMDELKSYFGFNMFSHYKSFKDFDINKINAIILDLENSKKFSLSNIDLPKILIQENSKANNSKNLFSLVVKLPLDIVQFNHDIINLCKKFEFKNNSLINVKGYVLDKNERMLKKNNIFLKITEKEINFIETLCSSPKPLRRDYILKKIWNYSTETDTHTVETHIYRLRQKIKKQFNDSNFIKNSKNGYFL